jgi:hypothetical protein
MTTCPNCKNAVVKPVKEWKYGSFDVQAYSCPHCGFFFREYFREGRHSFTLQRYKGKGWIKS